jgi:hypothetical protein
MHSITQCHGQILVTHVLLCLQGAVGAVGLHSSSGGGAASDRPHAYVEYENEDNAIIAVAAMHDSEGW